jgi:hypothetical protein
MSDFNSIADPPLNVPLNNFDTSMDNNQFGFDSWIIFSPK